MRFIPTLLVFSLYYHYTLNGHDSNLAANKGDLMLEIPRQGGEVGECSRVDGSSWTLGGKALGGMVRGLHPRPPFNIGTRSFPNCCWRRQPQ